MSVFLRWGIFGILAVAGLLYAYNASKKLAENRLKERPAVAQAPVSEIEAESETEPGSGPPLTPPHCEAELAVAQRALQARREGEPLDRLLRIPEIAWQEPPARRERLGKVATDWFNYEGEDPIPEALRIGVISTCVRLSPAP
jgi:hypothetical protein